MMRTGKDRRPWLLLAALLCAAVWAHPRPVAAADEDDFQVLIEEVGKEYAEGYLAPLGTCFGVDQNTAIFSTAAIPRTRLTLGIGAKFMAANIADDDATFRKVLNVTLDERYGVNPLDPAYGERGTVVMEGPTVFGNEDTPGTITAYYNGLPVGQVEGIEGFYDTSWMPLIVPQAEVGGIAGLRATLRWLPPVSGPGDLGDINLLGYGLQYNVSQHIPQPPMGLDFMVGFFRQELDLGDVVQTDATSFFLAASKTFAVITAYGGVAFEDSNIDVDYMEQVTGTHVAFTLDGKQERRVTVGGTVNLGLQQINAEMSFGKLATFGAGLMFGF
jgi:hypothetical protein